MNLSLTELTGALRDPIFADVPGLNGVSLSAQVIPTGDGVDVIAVRPHLHHSPDLPATLLSARADLPWTPGGHPTGLISREALLTLSPEELLTMEISAVRAFLRQKKPTTRGGPRPPLPLTAIIAGVTLLGLGLTGALLINAYLLFAVSIVLIIGGLLTLTADLPLTGPSAAPPNPQALIPCGSGRYHVSHWTRMIPTIPEITGTLRGPVAPGVTILGVSLPTQVETDSGTVQVHPTLHFTDQVLGSTRTARITPQVLHALRHDRTELTRISSDTPDTPVIPVNAFTAEAVQNAARQALLERVQRAGRAGQLCMRTLPLSVGPILLMLLHEPLNLHMPTLGPLCLSMLGVNAALLAVIIATHWTDLRVGMQSGPAPRLRPDQFEPGRFSYLQNRAAVTVPVAEPAAAAALPQRSADLREQVTAEGAERSLSTLRDAQRRAQALKAAHPDDAAFTARLDQLIERTQTEIDARREETHKRSRQQELETLEKTVQTELHYLNSLP